MIPESLEADPDAPVPSSISRSFITVLVVFTVAVVPFTFKFPEITTLSSSVISPPEAFIVKSPPEDRVRSE